MKLNELRPTIGSKRKMKRLGRGDSTGHGGTSTRGHKGQKSRSGGYHKRGFEGGQMPLQRRIPKHGFTNIFRREFAILNIGKLSVFPEGTEITPELLLEKGLIKKLKDGIKVLGGGDLGHALKVKGLHFSKQALAKLSAVGGSIT